MIAEPFPPGNIDAPWGRFAWTTALGFVEQCAAQLKWYLQTGKSPDPAVTRRDLFGYRELIALGDEETAKFFLAFKSAARDRGVQVRNFDVIHTMKRNGGWPRSKP